MASELPTAGLELDDVQRLVLQGYPSRPFATYALLQVTDAAAAKACLRASLDAPLAPQVPKEIGAVGAAEYADRQVDRDFGYLPRLALAFTWPGLRALGFPDDDPEFEGFVGEFREGMVTEHRSRILGDIGDNDPGKWEWGGPRNPDVHVLLIVFSESQSLRTADWNAVQARLDGLRVLNTPEGHLPPDQREHFGFRDGISQPYIEGSDTRLRPSGRYAAALTVKAGEFILGYPNEFATRPASPSVPVSPGNPADLRAHPEAPTQRWDFGRNGTYLVLRQLQQHVDAFELFVQKQADALGIDPDLMAAKLVGRWKSGAPLVMAPEKDDPTLETENGFAFHDEDRFGLRCPIGAHIRRANPRDAHADESLHVTPEKSAVLSNRHRLIRRGRLYAKAGGEKGLLFLCLNANLQRQFEFVQQHWIHGDKFGGLYDERDPLVGVVPGDRHNRMTIQGCPVARRTDALPRFVTVRGGAYFFMPGLRALRYLAELPAVPARPRPDVGEIPEFQPRRLWAGANRQTLRRELQAALPFGRPRLARWSTGEKRLEFPMANGDVLLGSYDVPKPARGEKPLVLLIHGLPGSDRSAVVLWSAAQLLRCGHPVLRLNLRGAGPSQGETRQLYHAGRSEDLHAVLSQLAQHPEEIAAHGVVPVGYSLGGNLLLKTLGEPQQRHSCVKAAVAVSAALDLAAVAEHMQDLTWFRDLVYVRYLLHITKKQVLKVHGLTEDQKKKIRGARSFREFDEGFLAGFSGFANATDYYAKASAKGFLKDIRVPTLLIHAPNDPIVPIGTYQDFDWSVNPNLRPLLTAPGGHAGFHGRGSAVAWHDRCLHGFLRQLGL